MGLAYENLDTSTRALMAQEIDLDLAGRGLYLSNYLTDRGKERWPLLLKEASAKGNDDSLANALNAEQCFKDRVERRKPKGGYTLAAVPHTAAQTLAESQFNMYYMRALSLRAISEGKRLEVYRAKQVENPRSESERMIGTTLDAANVLKVLRETLGVEPTIGIPLPNSGLSVKLV